MLGAHETRTENWLPLAAEALDQHGLRLSPDAFLGPGGSCPVVVSDDVVVKLFGRGGEWRAAWANERAAHDRLRLDERIRAPRLVARGEIESEEGDSRPYLILTRISGLSWCDAALSQEDRLAVARELGEQLAHVHKLPNCDLPTVDTWLMGTPADHILSGQFPTSLADHVDEWLETVPIDAPVFVHSDIFVRHPMIDGRRLSGIIDWGDAMSADPHVEIGKIHLDVFEGEKRLLIAFLDGHGWQVDDNFARRALAMAIRRHAQIHGQHGPGGDVFYRVPEILGDRVCASLDDLADALFGI